MKLKIRNVDIFKLDSDCFVILNYLETNYLTNDGTT